MFYIYLTLLIFILYCHLSCDLSTFIKIIFVPFIMEKAVDSPVHFLYIGQVRQSCRPGLENPPLLSVT